MTWIETLTSFIASVPLLLVCLVTVVLTVRSAEQIINRNPWAVLSILLATTTFHMALTR